MPRPEPSAIGRSLFQADPLVFPLIQALPAIGGSLHAELMTAKVSWEFVLFMAFDECSDRKPFELMEITFMGEALSVSVRGI